MAQRLDYVVGLSDRADAALGTTKIFATLDDLYNTWLLIEQTRKVYELVANHVDARYPTKRRSLDSRICNERSPASQATYHYRAWLYPILEHLPDSAFERLGLEPTPARALLRKIVDRSTARLDSEERDLRAFADDYAEICNAYKHGRAVFAMEPSFEMTGEKTGTFNVAASKSVGTVLVSEKPGEPAHAFLLIAIDKPLTVALEHVREILGRQVPRLLSFIEAFAGTFETALERVGKDRNEDPLPSFPFFTFGEPYSDEEQALLDSIGKGSLRLFE